MNYLSRWLLAAVLLLSLSLKAFAAQRAPDIYISEQPMSIEDTISDYFDILYRSYVSFNSVTDDLTELMDMEQDMCRNLMVWHQQLNQRRRLLKEQELCYVDTERKPYSIHYIEASELTDDRLKYWKREGNGGPENIMVHFVIIGDEGEVYPPFLAVNAQHTMRMKKIDGVWKIAYHYFPGSVRMYQDGEALLKLRPDEEVLAELLEEFDYEDVPEQPEVPENGVGYVPSDAVSYARRFTESRNPNFYHGGDWDGNCQNFASQCVWAGFSGGQTDPRLCFGEFTTDGWFGGTGGGSMPWENVGYFYRYVTSKNAGLICTFPGRVTSLEAGDLVQIAMDSSPDYFRHTLFLVDDEKMILGQNSPSCFIYYSDLVNMQKRFIHPVAVIP